MHFPYLTYLPVKLLGVAVLALLEVGRGQVVLGLGHVGVVAAQPLGVDVDGPLVVLLHLLVLALVLAQQRQVVELLGNVRVLPAEHLEICANGFLNKTYTKACLCAFGLRFSLSV